MENSYLPKRFDVTGKVDGIEGPISVAAWIFPAQGEARGVWFCLPGEGSTKAYYHLLVPGHPVQDYSFALHMAREGFIVVALDLLGTGESTHLEQCGVALTSERLAQANEEVVRQLKFGLQAGILHPEIPAYCSPLPIFGIGHSWGAKVLLMQDATNHRFDAIGIVGWSNLHRMAVENARYRSHHFGFAPDVPADVIAADDAQQASFPESVLEEAFDPLFMHSVVERIRVPIFLCLSAVVDVSTDLMAETKTYPQELVFSYALPGSHHRHNFAMTRILLWTLLADWATGILRYYYS